MTRLTWLDQHSSLLADRIVGLGERAAAFARRRVVEIVIVVVALAIRFSMLATYDPGGGYDAWDHLVYIQWFAHHLSLPDLMLCRETYHPPLYYLIEGRFSRLVHADVAVFGFTSMVFSSGTLLLTWVGFERYLPGRRLARIAGLGLAAFLPAAVQLAGMMSAEALNGLLATAALLLAAEALRRQHRGERIIVRAGIVGLLVGLEMLAKISGLVTLASIGAAVALDLVLRRESLGARLRRAAPWLMLVATLVATSGWYYARNHRLYGKTILSGFDGPDGVGAPALAPYLKRRPPEFFYGWSNDVLTAPSYPSAISPRSYFWPVAIATTFVDYYGYGFVRGPDGDHELMNGRPMRPAAVILARVSATAGVVVAVSTVIAWFWALVVCLRRRATAALVLLFAPALAVIGQLHFVIRYPYDFQGPIKGVYLQFAAAPLFALFGLAVFKMTRRRATWPIAVVQCAAVVAIASYTIYARVLAF